MQRKPSAIYAALAALILVIGLAAWLVNSLTELHDRFAPIDRPRCDISLRVDRVAHRGRLFHCAVRIAPAAQHSLETRTRGHDRGSRRPDSAGRRCDSPGRKSLGQGALTQELNDLRANHDRREFRVVIFGTGSAGKTSLINALSARRRQNRPRHRNDPHVREPYLFDGRRRRHCFPDRHTRPLRDRRPAALTVSEMRAIWPPGPIFWSLSSTMI